MIDKQDTNGKVHDEFKISSRLVRLGNAITRHRNLLAMAQELTSTQSEVVYFILNHDGREVSASDLMEHLNLSQSTVAGLLDRLAEKDFVIKTKHPLDSRKVILQPGQKGLALGRFLHELHEQTESVLLQGLSEEDLSDFERCLGIALDNMNKLRYAEKE